MIKDFEYFAPKTVEEAFALLSQYKDESKVIAGGQSLLILMRQKLVTPKYLIDIKGIAPLSYINFDVEEGLRIGALTSHRAIETSPVIQNGFAVLAEMEQRVSSVQTRNWGTIGGNLCHADPAGDPAPVLVALNAKLKMASSSGERTMAVEDFFKDYFETALQADELLMEIQVPNPSPHTGTALTKFSLIEGDYAIVGTAVSITVSSKNGTCTDVRIALSGTAPIPLRVQRAERVLVGKEIKDALLAQAGQVASEEADPTTDAHASEEYKRELIRVLVKRVGREALERAKRA